MTHTQPKVPNAVIGAYVFVASELVFFAGMVNAYLSFRSQIPVWPPLGQPRLPVELTAVNTVFLLISGVMLYLANKAFADPFLKTKTLRYLGLGIAFGGLFLLIQGYEWVELMLFADMRANHSIYAALFYMIIGTHAFHVVLTLAFLVYVFTKISQAKKHKDLAGTFFVGRIFWFFVVGVWPFLYIMVYVL